MQLGKGAYSSGQHESPRPQFESLESRAMLAYSFEVMYGPIADIFFPADSEQGDSSYVPPDQEVSNDVSDPLPVIPFDTSVAPFHQCPELPPELCLPGDLDGSGNVDFTDFLRLSTNMGLEDATWEDGDLTGDGLVSLADFLILSQNFGQSA